MPSLLKTALEQVPVGVLVAEAPSGRVAYANAHALRMLGAGILDLGSAAECCAWSTMDANGTTLELEETPLARALAGAAVRSAEVKVRKPDGRAEWFCVDATPIREADGSVAAAVLALRDMSAERQSACALSQRDQQLRLALDAGQMGAWSWDLGQDVFELDPMLRELHGLAHHGARIPIDALFGTLHPQDRLRARHRLARSIASGNAFELVYRVVRGGDTRTVACRGGVIYGEDGRPSRLVGVAVDVTDARRTEQAARRNQQRFRDVFDNSPAAMAVFSGDDLEITLVNRAWEAIAPPTALVGRTLLEVFPEASDEERLRIERVYGTGEPFVGIELAGGHVLQGAAPTWWNVVLQPFRDEDGTITDVLLQAVDVTEQVRCRLDLEESDAAKGRFIAALSHEVRTPLTAIVGYADMLAAELGGPLTAAQQHQVERVKASAWHTVSVLEQILTYSRAAAGELEVAAECVDLTDVVRDAVALLMPQAGDRGIAIEVDMPATALPVVTDAGKVRQIIVNLLSNAVKFTDGRAVRVSCALQNGCIETIVQDEGPGIPADKREIIFELFRRDGIQHSDADGAGLGLPVSRQLARRLGGELTVDTVSGCGSRFRLALPHNDRPFLATERTVPVLVAADAR